MKTFKGLYNQIKHYKFRSVFFNNFFKFFMLIGVIIIIISTIMYIYFNFLQNSEILEINATEIKKDATLADNLFREAEHIASGLIIDDWIGIYISDITAPQTFNEASSRVQSKLASYLRINEYIDSIYVYSSEYGKVCTATEELDISDFSDNKFLDVFNGQTEEFMSWTRQKDDKYPYLISFGKKRNPIKESGGVIVNINTEELVRVLGYTEKQDRSMYIVDNSGTIIYTTIRNEYMRPYSENECLKLIIDDNDEKNCIIGENIVSLEKSKYYDWQYVTVCSYKAPKVRLNNFYHVIWIIVGIMLIMGMVLALLMGSTTVSPVIDIVDLLENPNKYEKTKKIYDNEIKQIEDKIMFIIYNNDNLKKELENRNAQLNKVQMYALQQQINPHFINNTLNIISLMLMSEFGKGHNSIKMVGLLSKQLNNCLKVNNILVTVSEEIENAKVYVDLLKCRKNNFEVIFDIDESIMQEKIIKMILQPIIENAMFYGFANKEQNGKISLCSKVYDDRYVISVIDNGNGMDAKTLESLKEKMESWSMHDSKGIGLANVNQRLKIMFGTEYGVDIKSELGFGTSVSITVPRKNNKA